MKIWLGSYEAASGAVIEAWIEPNRPTYRGDQVRDSGFLCVADQQMLDLRLESTSEDSWKLIDEVGMELGRRLWEERQRYDRTPYCMVYDHAQFGRLYFEPGGLPHSAPSISFHTRPDGRYPQEGTEIPLDRASDQLQALFMHEHLSMQPGLIPDTHQLDAAIAQGQRAAAAAITALADYSALVDWDFDSRLSVAMVAATGHQPLKEGDIERYEALSAWAHRPQLHSFEGGDTPEFYRWYEHGGRARLEPLTSEELTTYLRNERGYAPEEAERAGRMAAVPRMDWEWFKDARLGVLHEPVQTLHDLINQERVQPTTDRAWLRKAMTASNFCTPTAVSPAKVLDAIQEFIATSQRGYALALRQGDDEATERQLAALSSNPAYQKAIAAVALLQDPTNGLAAERGSRLLDTTPPRPGDGDAAAGQAVDPPAAQYRDEHYFGP